jgi:hypothetical protein
VAVAADMIRKKTITLEKNIRDNPRQSSKNCTKFWNEGKLWKPKKVTSREQKTFKSALNAISRQIVSFAESLGSGIRLKKNSSHRATRTGHRADGSYDFSFENNSFCFAPGAGRETGRWPGHSGQLREPGIHILALLPMRRVWQGVQETFPSARIAGTLPMPISMRHSLLLRHHSGMRRAHALHMGNRSFPAPERKICGSRFKNR